MAENEGHTIHIHTKPEQNDATKHIQNRAFDEHMMDLFVWKKSTIS